MFANISDVAFKNSSIQRHTHLVCLLL